MPIATKSYVLVPDGKGGTKAVVQDGTQTGAILVGAGGTIDADVAKQFGVSVKSDADVASDAAALEQRRLDDLNAARLDLGPAPAAPSGQVTDAPAVHAAEQAVLAADAGTSPLAPAKP